MHERFCGSLPTQPAVNGRDRPPMTGQSKLAERTVTGVIAGMVIATAAATIVGFWLSYRGLRDFATRAGLTGAEAWAWPASVDLFIAAGEAGSPSPRCGGTRTGRYGCISGSGSRRASPATFCTLTPLGCSGPGMPSPCLRSRRCWPLLRCCGMCTGSSPSWSSRSRAAISAGRQPMTHPFQGTREGRRFAGGLLRQCLFGAERPRAN